MAAQGPRHLERAGRHRPVAAMAPSRPGLLDMASREPGLAGAFSPFNARIPAQNYFDLAMTAKVGDHYQFRLGVNNMLDKAPPIIGSQRRRRGSTLPGHLLQRQHLPRHLRRARPLHLRRRHARLLTRWAGGRAAVGAGAGGGVPAPPPRPGSPRCRSRRSRRPRKWGPLDPSLVRRHGDALPARRHASARRARHASRLVAGTGHRSAATRSKTMLSSVPSCSRRRPIAGSLSCSCGTGHRHPWLVARHRRDLIEAVQAGLARVVREAGRATEIRAEIRSSGTRAFASGCSTRWRCPCCCRARKARRRARDGRDRGRGRRRGDGVGLSGGHDRCRARSSSGGRPGAARTSRWSPTGGRTEGGRLTAAASNPKAERQRTSELFRSMFWPSSAPSAPPIKVPATRLWPPSMTLPSKAPPAPPTIRPVVPSLRLQ